jgi:hypothetical protein
MYLRSSMLRSKHKKTELAGRVSFGIVAEPGEKALTWDNERQRGGLSIFPSLFVRITEFDAFDEKMEERNEQGQESGSRDGVTTTRTEDILNLAFHHTQSTQTRRIGVDL